MARASEATLKQLHSLLVELRKIPELTETKTGIFYVKRVPMLHFHETDQGIVADLKCVAPAVSGFDRLDAGSEGARKTLLAEAAKRCRVLQLKRYS